MGQKLVQDTMQSMLLKEAKPVVKVSHQGKYLTPLLDTSADVFALGIGGKNESYMLIEVPRKEPDHKLSHEPPHNFEVKTLSRGGYDATIRSATKPEFNPKPYSTSQGANQDIHALKMPYLTNQEGLNHEDNFYGFYTHEGAHSNWNRSKVFTEKEVMNFTSQRFLNPSIYEYPTL
ncbi:hypothetical protein DY000_02024017 [Brassica cretica]|uniref:Xylanase inhibitor C-terminal domain-containing protein n=1 Tax=Brassica cretica TaxID=69181 RepID=A0ABQ7E6E1_BRACR|nr:hypothetical protein DY000_02024017 [Brassica cretica]